MVKTNFIELYGLGDIPKLVQEKLEERCGGSSRKDLVNTALRIETNFEHYNVRRRKREDLIQFSTDCFQDNKSNILLLSANVRYAWSFKQSLHRFAWFFEHSSSQKKRIVVALRYEQIENNVGIEYVQSVSGVEIKQYREVQEVLGVRPHELLAAHLIARVAPVLDMYPDMAVIFPDHKRESYGSIRERFAKKSRLGGYELNPRKERVSQIFGAESPWLEAHRND